MLDFSSIDVLVEHTKKIVAPLLLLYRITTSHVDYHVAPNPNSSKTISALILNFQKHLTLLKQSKQSLRSTTSLSHFSFDIQDTKSFTYCAFNACPRLSQVSRTETPFNPIDGPIEAHRWPSQLFPMGIDGPSMAIDGI